MRCKLFFCMSLLNCLFIHPAVGLSHDTEMMAIEGPSIVYSASDESLNSIKPFDSTKQSQLYQAEIDAIYRLRDQSLIWFNQENSAALRHELKWQLLEMALAGGPGEFEVWLTNLDQASTPKDEIDRIYTQAFIGLMVIYDRLKQFDYSQMASLSTLHELPLELPEVTNVISTLTSNANLPKVLFTKIGGEVKSLPVRNQLSYLLALDQGPWEEIKHGEMIFPDDEDARIPLIRRRIFELGGGTTHSSDFAHFYDHHLVSLVKTFQQQHGLKVDGVIGPDTRYWLNVSPIKRARMQALNLLRMRLMNQYLPGQFVLVNVPSFQLYLYRQGEVDFTSKVIVGRRSRPTPMLHSLISNVVLNPPWNVPRKILVKDIVPKLRNDPEYLIRGDYRLFDNQGARVPFEEVDWDAVKNAGQFPYRVQQQPGDGNALGRYKFHFSNRYAVYLHDTSTPALFGEVSRGLSSGCVRVEKSGELAHLLLDRIGISENEQSKMIAKGKTKWVSLLQPLPVFTVYWTAWVDQRGVPQYRRDIYHMDEALLQFKGFTAAQHIHFSHS